MGSTAAVACRKLSTSAQAYASCRASAVPKGVARKSAGVHDDCQGMQAARRQRVRQQRRGAVGGFGDSEGNDAAVHGGRQQQRQRELQREHDLRGRQRRKEGALIASMAKRAL